ncbi:MAG: SDR family oxidoreductase [Bauldia sp.]
MRIDVTGEKVRLIGIGHPLAAAVIDALRGDGAEIDASPAHDTDRPPDILVVSCPVVAADDGNDAALLDRALAIGRAMTARQGARIVFLISAIGVVPMRRHLRQSARAAALVAAVRGYAMELAPNVRVNAVGAGAIAGLAPDAPPLAGDLAMLSHVPLARAGTAAEVTAAALFLCDPVNSYTTGQVLVVDGGWAAGYARNF